MRYIFNRTCRTYLRALFVSQTSFLRNTFCICSDLHFADGIFDLEASLISKTCGVCLLRFGRTLTAWRCFCSDLLQTKFSKVQIRSDFWEIPLQCNEQLKSPSVLMATAQYEWAIWCCFHGCCCYYFRRCLQNVSLLVDEHRTPCFNCYWHACRARRKVYWR